ncbi:helix-turn-helix transcriptional regulator [Pseudomonas fragi]|uniref:helix-turn-helix transcriptional regulator n=1 Tax=Pseudomonas fragi TaxID=296 RepID=UPI000375E9A5|nr:AlpA family transcriptional regulator [Pseudomonas fragi]MDE4514943.1 AlpA family transcriptional regulator [Pseudomonas fragi]QPC36479.1 AlpA family transcriptional regulator [Pseudomonas fragi]SDU40517.1 transcriptional regulator, AlpA family [Pseudomonas fragi]
MEISFSNATPERRILRLPEVQVRTGFKRAHIYNLISQGRFPKSVQLGARAVGWDSHAVEQWVEDRISGEPSRRTGKGGEIQ